MIEEKKPVIDRAGLVHPEDERDLSAEDEVLISDLPERSFARDGARGPIAWLNHHLTSLPSAVVVLCVIAALSIIGTFVPQGESFSAYVGQYGEMKAKVLTRLGFTDIYHTIYFNLLLFWLGLSSIWCSIKRAVITWKLQFMPRIKIRASTIEKMEHSHAVNVKDEAAALDRFEQRLRKKGFRTYRLEQPGGAHNLYAARGMRRMWALVALHLGLIVVLAGALIGLIFGTNGFIRLEDGETKVLTVHPGEADYCVSVKGGNSHAPGAGMKQPTGSAKPKLIRSLVRNIEPMVFTLDLDQFEITYDKLIKPSVIAGMPEKWIKFESYIVHQFTSHFKVTRNGRSKEKIIAVNHPLTLDKLMFYQSSYSRGIELIVETSDGDTFSQVVDMNVPFEVTPEGLRSVGRFGAATSPFFFRIDEIKGGPLHEGREITGELDPMISISIFSSENGQMMGMDVIKNDHPLMLPDFSLGIGKETIGASVFQYKRDPGLPLVYLGFLILVLGTLGALFMHFQQMYLCIEGQKARLGLRSTGIADDADKLFVSVTGD
ncbi:cytochrome c biogenesis protein ResB [bacterium]|nr:cytochrome c biogenesis protein ResB [bacterium]